MGCEEEARTISRGAREEEVGCCPQFMVALDIVPGAKCGAGSGDDPNSMPNADFGIVFGLGASLSIGPCLGVGELDHDPGGSRRG